MTQAFSQTASEEIVVKCSKADLYQWQMSATEINGISSQDFNVKGNSYVCTNAGKPKCVAGNCNDDECQTCLQSQLSLPSFKIDPIYLHKPKSFDEPLPIPYYNWIKLICLIFIVLCITSLCYIIYSKFIKKRSKSADSGLVKIYDLEENASLNHE